mgnify:CR=1 FL=1
MPYFSDDIIEEVRSRNDIVDVIGQYVHLTKKGSTYFGLCPFHNEKTGSFSVSPNKQMYYCFGCGAGGNVFTFMMQYENFTFGEAMEALADRAGVALPKQEYSAAQKREADKKQRLLEINKEAARYFYTLLRNDRGKHALAYFQKRELSEETMKKFGLGYSDQYSDDLYRYLRSKGYEDEILKESGLVTIDERRGGYDKFWNRAMFPIMDVHNKVIGFGGRVMGDGEPKYLNSPETIVFDKSRNLYGLNYARTSRENYILLCEGYMDVIAMQQAGFQNAVASLGTAFTSQQAMLLKRYTELVILTYDSDGAGVKAALRAIPILRNVGVSAKVLDLKPYKDPDEFIKNMGADAFRERIADAKNSFLFEIEVLKRDYQMQDPEQRTKFIHATAEKLLEFTEPLERDNYIQAVAREQMISYKDLRSLVNRLGLSRGLGERSSQNSEYGNSGSGLNGGGNRERKKKVDKDEGIRRSQRLLLTWLIEKPKLFEKIHGIIGPDDFDEPLYHQVAEMVFAEQEKGNLNPAEILNHFINDEEQYKEVAGLFHANLKESLNNEEQKKAFSDTVLKVRKHSLDEASRHAVDIVQLQKIIQEQASLKTLHIEID